MNQYKFAWFFVGAKFYCPCFTALYFTSVCCLIDSPKVLEFMKTIQIKLIKRENWNIIYVYSIPSLVHYLFLFLKSLFKLKVISLLVSVKFYSTKVASLLFFITNAISTLLISIVYKYETFEKKIQNKTKILAVSHLSLFLKGLT